MRYLIGVALALTLTGCKAKVEERKNVVCFQDEVCTYRGVAQDKIFVLYKNDTHYFVFVDEQGEKIILDLKDKQCGIN